MHVDMVVSAYFIVVGIAHTQKHEKESRCTVHDAVSPFARCLALTVYSLDSQSPLAARKRLFAATSSLGTDHHYLLSFPYPPQYNTIQAGGGEKHDGYL